MKFPLLHKGRRFFFFTFTVEKRYRLLSKLTRGEKWPTLSSKGERVVALWRRLHTLDPHLTPSDFIIMPDHVHLLLMVHSADEFYFNPSVFSQWFLRMTERATPPERLAVPPASWDYIDFRDTDPAPQHSEADRIPWSKEYWINISFDSHQLSAIRRYIRMNPARYFWKHDNPDRFKAIFPLKHPILDDSLPWTAVGDITILASPFLYFVRLTRKKSLAELEDEIRCALIRARIGWTPVCGFLSPGEREFEKRLKALPQSRWIKTVPYGLPERFDPSVEDSRWIADGRQLILSSFDAGTFPPFQTTRAGCLLMNDRTGKMIQALQKR